MSLVFLVINATTVDSRYNVSTFACQCVFLNHHWVVDWLHALACSGSTLAFAHITYIYTTHTLNINIFSIHILHYISYAPSDEHLFYSIPIQKHYLPTILTHHIFCYKIEIVIFLFVFFSSSFIFLFSPLDPFFSP